MATKKNAPKKAVEASKPGASPEPPEVEIIRDLVQIIVTLHGRYTNNVPGYPALARAREFLAKHGG